MTQLEFFFKFQLHKERGKLPLNSRGLDGSALKHHPLASMRAK